MRIQDITIILHTQYSKRVSFIENRNEVTYYVPSRPLLTFVERDYVNPHNASTTPDHLESLNDVSGK